MPRQHASEKWGGGLPGGGGGGLIYVVGEGKEEEEQEFPLSRRGGCPGSPIEGWNSPNCWKEKGNGKTKGFPHMDRSISREISPWHHAKK